MRLTVQCHVQIATQLLQNQSPSINVRLTTADVPELGGQEPTALAMSKISTTFFPFATTLPLFHWFFIAFFFFTILSI